MIWLKREWFEPQQPHTPPTHFYYDVFVDDVWCGFVFAYDDGQWEACPGGDNCLKSTRAMSVTAAARHLLRLPRPASTEEVVHAVL